MPRYHFHLRTEEGLESDEVGLDFDGLEAAYLEAYATIPALFAEMVRDGRDPSRCRFEIADAAGRSLIEIPFSERLIRAPGPPGAHDRTGALLDRLDRVLHGMQAESHSAWAHVFRSRAALSRLRQCDAERDDLYERTLRGIGARG